MTAAPLGVAVGIAVCAALVAGCGGQRAPAPTSSSAHTVGHFPVASAPAAVHDPVRATPGHPGIMVMGDTVEARLPVAIDVAVTARGPAFHLPETIPVSARGVITVSIVGVHGVHSVRTSDFYAVDDKHQRVALTPRRLGDRLATGSTAPTSLAPGQRLTFTLSGTFRAGNASLVWRPDGIAMGVWEFTADYD
jgi:hypothetical protein